MAVLTADLQFVDANDQFLAEAGRELQELIGHNIFEVFPKMPADLGDTERTVLEEAFDTGRRAYLALARYDLEDPVQAGAFVETYWSAVAQPIRGLDGQVEMYELSLRNMTPVIAEFKAMQARHEASSSEGELPT